MVAVMQKHHHRHLHFFDELPHGIGQDRRGTGRRIARLGVHGQDTVILVQHLFHRVDQPAVGGEFALAHTADPLHENGAAIVTVHRGDVVHLVREGGNGIEIKIHKIHVVIE